MAQPILPAPALSSVSSSDSDLATRAARVFAHLIRVVLHLTNVGIAILIFSLAIAAFVSGDGPSVFCGIYLTIVSLFILLLEVRTPTVVRSKASFLLSVSGRGVCYQLCGAAAIGLDATLLQSTPYYGGTPCYFYRETWPAIVALVIFGIGILMTVLGFIPKLGDPDYFYRPKTKLPPCNRRSHRLLATMANITIIVVLLALAILDFLLGSPGSIFAGIYTILFIVLLVLSEIRSSAPSFAVINNFVGRGIVYQLVGALNAVAIRFLPNNIMAGFVVGVGIIYLYLGLCGIQMYPPAEGEITLPTRPDSPLYSNADTVPKSIPERVSRGSEDDEAAPFLVDQNTRNDNRV